MSLQHVGDRVASISFRPFEKFDGPPVPTLTVNASHSLTIIPVNLGVIRRRGEKGIRERGSHRSFSYRG